MSEKWTEYKINRNKFAGFIGCAATVDDKSGHWWLTTTDNKVIKLIVEEDSK
jgi:hypothetical protein